MPQAELDNLEPVEELEKGALQAQLGRLDLLEQLGNLEQGDLMALLVHLEPEESREQQVPLEQED